MENKVKTQQELGAVHLEKKGLDKERFKDLIKGHKVCHRGIDSSLDSDRKFIENWLNGEFIWVSATEPEPESKLITLDELEEMLKGGKAEETKVLKVGDKIELCGIDYEVKYAEEFYLHSFEHMNYRCFEFMGTDKRFEFQERVLGYKTSGDFPFCRSRKDLTKFVNAIREEYQKHINKMKSNTTTKITRKQLGEIYPLVCGNWQDRINEVLAQNMFNDTVNVDNELLLKAYQHANDRRHTYWLDDVTGGINNLKPQIELGRWYWVEAQGGHKQDALIYVQDLSKECKGNYGFSHEGCWLDGVSNGNGGTGSYAIWNNLDYLKLAKDSEVEESLVKEAERRGFKKGVKTKGTNGSNEISTMTRGFVYNYEDNVLKINCSGAYFKKRNIFENGRWAEIIEDELKYVWLKTKRKGKLVIEQHPEKQLVNLMSNGWEKLTQSDLEKIKKEL